ncbi:hypothetical protein L0P88_17770 [Muricauda sp. SCSIO 64092]|uniref:hypothetical protein n=1 Tax=Allomuricauda sp. SCSIO 64092 TaxID=2908842 RepID=UPI001FF16B7D|nr:hypothetical protein [Muricauda sp. SCSIO 64092]UOY05775.1 hypothetical protein L0P88_17770 [Muricauda sp. SCSIO 64092]
MKELFEKISSYNIFNYLLPGVIFGFWISKEAGFEIDGDILTKAFIYYFLGLVVSRFGSLVIEPFLKWVKIAKFESYKDHIKASKKDDKIDLLSEVNNMYRTIIGLISLIGLIKIYLWIEMKFTCLVNWRIPITLIVLLLMFTLSYRKQTGYISKRIKSNLNGK